MYEHSDKNWETTLNEIKKLSEEKSNEPLTGIAKSGA